MNNEQKAMIEELKASKKSSQKSKDLAENLFSEFFNKDGEIVNEEYQKLLDKLVSSVNSIIKLSRKTAKTKGIDEKNDDSEKFDKVRGTLTNSLIDYAIDFTLGTLYAEDLDDYSGKHLNTKTNDHWLQFHKFN